MDMSDKPGFPYDAIRPEDCWVEPSTSGRLVLVDDDGTETPVPVTRTELVNGRQRIWFDPPTGPDWPTQLRFIPN